LIGVFAYRNSLHLAALTPDTDEPAVRGNESRRVPFIGEPGEASPRP